LVWSIGVWMPGGPFQPTDYNNETDNNVCGKVNNWSCERPNKSCLVLHWRRSIFRWWLYWVNLTGSVTTG